jgi:hypothetical protein
VVRSGCSHVEHGFPNSLDGLVQFVDGIPYPAMHLVGVLQGQGTVQAEAGREQGVDHAVVQDGGDPVSVGGQVSVGAGFGRIGGIAASRLRLEY